MKFRRFLAVAAIALLPFWALPSAAQTTSKIVTDATATGQTGAIQTGNKAASVTFTFCGTGFSGDVDVDAGATQAALAEVSTQTLVNNSNCTTTYTASPATKWYRVRWTRTAGTLNAWMTLGEPSYGGGGGITNGAGANVIPKSDGTNLVASAISEASAGSLATSAGTALGLTATAPAATTGASQAGKDVTITASPAVASTDTAGAAAGGSVTITAGAAARNTSGNANGGHVRLVGAGGIGTGTNGGVIIPNLPNSLASPQLMLLTGEAGSEPARSFAIWTNSSTDSSAAWFAIRGTNTIAMKNGGWTLPSGGSYSWSATATNALSTDQDTFLRRRGAANPAWGAAAATPVAYTHTLAADASSADTAGANAVITPGVGRGSGAGSTVTISTPDVGSSGSTVQTLTPRVVVGPDSVIIATDTTIRPERIQVLSDGIANQGADQVTARFTNQTRSGNSSQGALYASLAQGDAGSLSYVIKGANVNGHNGGGYLTADSAALGGLFTSIGGYTGGTNIGVAGKAESNGLNIGSLGYAKNGTSAVGVIGHAEAASGRSIGGLFSVTEPSGTYASSAIIGDNRNEAAAILLLYDNGTLKLSVNNGGGVNLQREVEANTAGVGSPNILVDTESHAVLTNEGAAALNYHTLPTAVKGLTFVFVVQDVDGLRVTANSGDTIRVIDKVTAAAGYISSTTIGSVVTLVAINTTEWYATAIHGSWTDGTFTYNDTSLTTP